MTTAPHSRLFFLSTMSLWRREVVRFVRQRSRVVGAFATPVVFWLLLGGGMRDSFQLPGSARSVHYLEYSFPGMVVLIVLFTAIFSMISVIEDRREGFLQAVLAAPVSRSSIVVGKVLGSTTLALIQALVFLALGPLAGLSFTFGSAAACFGVLVIVSVGLSALGFLMAWPMDSTQGFHALMNLVLMPMWLLSGAFFPASGASPWLSWLMALNPLTYGVAALRHAMYTGTTQVSTNLPSFALSLAVTVGFAVVAVVLSGRIAERSH